jgi:hypothetical protein
VAGKPKGGTRPGAGAPLILPKQKPDELAEILADNIINGKGEAQLQKQTGLSERGASALKLASRIEFAEYHEAFRERAQQLVLKASDLLAEKLQNGEGSMGQLTMLAGVFQDKINQQKATGPQSLHLHLHGKDRDTVLKQVMGRDTERAIDLPALSELGPNVPTPVIDLPPTTPTIGAEDS